jgi:hypothetical protein
VTRRSSLKIETVSSQLSAIRFHPERGVIYEKRFTFHVSRFLDD